MGIILCMFIVPLSLYMLLCYLGGRTLCQNNSTAYNGSKIDKKMLLNIIERTINEANGWQFEEIVAKIFEMNGYNVQLTSKTGDGGKDIILNHDIYVECKKYKNNAITNSIVLKLIGACSVDNIKKAIIITTATYTKSAIEVIENSSNIKIERWYTNDLLEMCKEINMLELLEWIGYDPEEIESISKNNISV